MIIQHLRNIPPLEERGLYYQLYRGYVAALSTRELCTFIESHFTFTKLERKLLLDRLAKDVSHKCTKEHENLFTKLLDVADQQESYLQKMYYAKFIEALLPHVSKEPPRNGCRLLPEVRVCLQSPSGLHVLGNK